MNYLLDTSTVSFAIRKRYGVDERIRTIPRSSLAIGSVVLAEGLTGAWKSDPPNRWLSLWQAYLDGWRVVAFDVAAAHRYARIRADLERRGCMIGHADCQIAATALAWEQETGGPVTLVTDNVAEFNRVPDLRIENWAVR